MRVTGVRWTNPRLTESPILLVALADQLESWTSERTVIDSPAAPPGRLFAKYQRMSMSSRSASKFDQSEPTVNR